MNKSALITPSLVLQAVELTTPTIESIIKLDPKRNVIYMVVPDPVVAAAREYEPLWSGAIGEQNRDQWANPYDEFATEKVKLTIRTGLPSHLVQHDFAHIYIAGDFKYGGSENRKGIIVGASGLAWHHDYTVSAIVAATIDGLVKGAFEAEYARKPYLIGAT
jgi:hypothetical protein